MSERRIVRLLSRPAKKTGTVEAAPERPVRGQRATLWRAAYDAGESICDIAKRFGVSRQWVSTALRRTPNWQPRGPQPGSGKWGPMLRALPVVQGTLITGKSAGFIHTYAGRLGMKFITRETAEGVWIWRIE